MGLFSSSQSAEDKAQLIAINEYYAVISFSPNGIILSANDNFLDALGYELNEITGKHHKIFCEELYANSNEYKKFWEDLNSGKAQISEFRRIKKNGESIFIHASYKPIKNSSGKVIKIIKFAQDITERKLENIYFKGQLEAINKSQAVIEFDMSGNVLSANENFLNALGYSLNEILGKHHSIFVTDSYKSSSEYKNFWEKLRAGNFDSGEYLRVGKNGKRVWIQAT